MFCKHDWYITEQSNILQQDEMGYPLRLVIVKCKKCGKTKQIWIDVPESQLFNPKNVILKWEK